MNLVALGSATVLRDRGLLAILRTFPLPRTSVGTFTRSTSTWTIRPRETPKGALILTSALPASLLASALHPRVGTCRNFVVCNAD